MEISKLQSHVLSFRDERDRKQFHNPKDLAQAVAIEAGELMEHFLWRSEEQSYEIGHNEDVHDEFADVLSNLLLFADSCGIDIEHALLHKMAKNDKKYPVEKVKWKSDKYTQYIACKEERSKA